MDLTVGTFGFGVLGSGDYGIRDVGFKDVGLGEWGCMASGVGGLRLHAVRFQFLRAVRSRGFPA